MVLKGEQHAWVKTKENNQNCLHATKQWNEADFISSYLIFIYMLTECFLKYEVNTKLIPNVGAFKGQSMYKPKIALYFVLFSSSTH